MILHRTNGLVETMRALRVVEFNSRCQGTPSGLQKVKRDVSQESIMFVCISVQ